MVNARKKHIKCIRDWRTANFKVVSRARYYGWEFPRELAKIIIAYAQEPKLIFISSDGNCPFCDPDDGDPEWPCDWHDELQPNPEYIHLSLRDLQFNS